MSENVVTITDDNFQEEVLNSTEPVVVDFWAPWCGPCKRLGPTIDELANDYAGKAKVGKLNTDDNIQVASQFGVSSIPTVIVFKGGEPVDGGRITGLQPKDAFVKILDQHV